MVLLCMLGLGLLCRVVISNGSVFGSFRLVSLISVRWCMLGLVFFRCSDSLRILGRVVFL